MVRSPGGLGFESAPFKMTREYIELLDGSASPLYQAFCSLFVQGFLALRAAKSGLLALLVWWSSLLLVNCQLMLTQEASMSMPYAVCLRGGQSVLDGVQARLAQCVTRKEAVSIAIELLKTAENSWSTEKYDWYSVDILLW